MVKTINLSLRSGLVPIYFKHAVVNLILKKSNLDPLGPKKYSIGPYLNFHLSPKCWKK